MPSRFILCMETTRQEMIQSAIQNGLTNSETIRLSKRMDAIMNIYRKSRKSETAVQLQGK